MAAESYARPTKSRVEGRKAARNGASRLSCKLPMGSQERTDWMRGYYEATDEEVKAELAKTGR